MNAPVIAGTVFAAFSFWLLLYAIRSLRKADQSMQWPVTDGKIVHIRLWGTRNVAGEQKPVEKLSVSYQYSVAGKRFEANRVAFYTLVYPETVEFADAHTQGDGVQVYYDPGEPSESVLLRGRKGGSKSYSDILLAGACLGISVVLVTLGGMGIIG